ncbi:DUF1648 domain-containing protein [Pollutibacter soli]|uniref:DUF1648 domain-containing protein n=1 Tax=Pollutibacter soli TaxID=3034157 RepID=UPI003013D7DC
MNRETNSPTQPEKILKRLTWIIVFANWVLAISKYSSLPEQVPIHFDWSGTPDNYGNRATIFLLPIISTVFIGWIAGLKAGISYFRLPVNGDPKEASLMMQALCLAMSILFLTITWKTIEVATGKAEVLGGWLLPFVILLICIPTIFFLIRNFRKSK